MTDGIVPALRFGDATTDRPAPRTLDLRRTETPRLGDMPAEQRTSRQRRRYAVVMFDSDGRFTDQRLFSQLEWTPGTRVDIGVGEGHEIVVRRDEQGGSALTSRNMVLVPAPLRRWCSYEAGDPVLVVAVPSMSAVVLHTLETLDQALPDPRRIVERMRPAGVPPGHAGLTPAVSADDCGDGERTTGPEARDGDEAEYASGLGGGHE